MMEYLPINVALLKHPLNYVTVFLMVLLPLSVLAIANDRLKPDA